MFASAEDRVQVDIISHTLLTCCYSVVCAIINRNTTPSTSIWHHILFILSNPSCNFYLLVFVSLSWSSWYTETTITSSMDQRPFLSHRNSPSFSILPCIRLQSAILHTGMRTIITLDSYMPFGLLSLARAVFPNLFDVAVPLTSLFISHGTPWGKHLFF